MTDDVVRQVMMEAKQNYRRMIAEKTAGARRFLFASAIKQAVSWWYNGDTFHFGVPEMSNLYYRVRTMWIAEREASNKSRGKGRQTSFAYANSQDSGDSGEDSRPNLQALRDEQLELWPSMNMPS